VNADLPAWRDMMQITKKTLPYIFEEESENPKSSTENDLCMEHNQKGWLGGWPKPYLENHHYLVETKKKRL